MANQQSTKFQVAISSDFFESFAGIPRAQQAKVIRFIDMFKQNPTSTGINYEKIRDGKDSQLHSVRIDQTYRGIIYKPPRGNVYLLLWVDHHDRAYDWARNRMCRINPDTGGIQVYNVAEADIVPQAPAVPQALPALFAAFRDRQLLKLGVPSEFLTRVRSITSDEQLEALDGILPQEASEALYMLASGYSEEEVYRELEISSDLNKVDPEDFQTALSNNDTLRRFYVVEDQLELQAVLKAPLDKWRVFLHPSQRRLVERNWDGHIRLLGGAGTGKTVAAMHRARWLVEKCFTGPNERILFTTYTRNLAADIKHCLEEICPAEIFKRIEVRNLDKWVGDFLRRHDYPYRIAYGKDTRECWEKALTVAPTGIGLSDGFYNEEWEKVIQARDIDSFADYLRASRNGRGTRLSRQMKKKIWPVFEEYRLLLNQKKLRERDDALRDAAKIIENRDIVLPYKAIVVDEAQDMGPQAFKLIAAMVPGDLPNSLFIVGDPHQRIYKAKATLSQCGINIRGRRSHRLRINYRTTEETRKWAHRVLRDLKIDDMDGGDDHQKGYRSLMHGIPPVIKHFDSFDDEINWLTETLQAADAVAPANTCLVVRTNNLLEQYKSELEARGINVYKLQRDQPDDRGRKDLRIATMHRVKGLEFDHIIIAAVNEGVVPLRTKPTIPDDPMVKKEIDQIERSLLYVSATRARKSVIITSYGNPGPFIAAPG
ncbi:MAG: AAA family ATPase [bacterium]|nr:AAA family ATPase [bacterium]